MQYFNIQVASQLSGVASATIRAWEKRYNAVVPERGENKHRLYSDKDIEKLALLYKLTEFGQSIGKIAHLDLEELKEVYSSLMQRPYDDIQVMTPHQGHLNLDELRSNIFVALSAFKTDIIAHELNKAKSTLSLKELCLSLIVPLFKELTLKIKNNELNFTEERTLTSLITFQLGSILSNHYQRPASQDALILMASPEPQTNERLTLPFALLCAHYKLNFIYLGGNVSAESLIQTAQRLKPRHIFIGTDYEITNYLSDLTSGLSTHSEIWISGELSQDERNELLRRKISFFPTAESLDKALNVLQNR